MKKVKVSVTLQLEDDQPVCDWIYNVIAKELSENEKILHCWCFYNNPQLSHSQL